MALTQGMLERFKQLTSNEDSTLLKIQTQYKPIYGYLREVGSDFFVIHEVHHIVIDHSVGDRYSRGPEPEDKIEEIGLTTFSLAEVESWTVITKEILLRS